MIKSVLILLSSGLFCVGLNYALTGGTAARSQSAPGSAWLDPEVNRLLLDMEDFNRRIGMLNVTRGDGIFLKMLVETAGAKNVLEIGTSNGYSGIWFGLALKNTGGRLTTIDIDPDKVRMARENFKKAGVSSLITVHEGDAHEVIRKLDGPFDFVFLDAEKSGYLDYLKTVLPKVKPGTIIAGHNAINLASGMQDYLDFAHDSPNLATVIVSTGSDGICLSRKIR